MQKTINVGIIGYGGIGRLHAYAYWNIPFYYRDAQVRAKLYGVCDTNKSNLEDARREAPFEFYTENVDELIARKDIEAIHVCTPNFLHVPMIEKAIAAGKHVYSEKPLGINADEADKARRLVEFSNIRNRVAFQYRYVPAVAKAKQLMGKIGQVFHFRGAFYISNFEDRNRVYSWRSDHVVSGGGALIDLGSHVIDLLLYLVGDITEVSSLCQTFINERPESVGSTNFITVTAEDYASIRLKTKNGAVGVIEVSRTALGYGEALSFEIFGEKGAIRFCMDDPNVLYFYNLEGERGCTAIRTAGFFSESIFPAGRSPVGWARFAVANQYEFLKDIANGKTRSPNFNDGYKVQKVIDAAYISNNNNNATIKI